MVFDVNDGYRQIQSGFVIYFVFYPPNFSLINFFQFLICQFSRVHEKNGFIFRYVILKIGKNDILSINKLEVIVEAAMIVFLLSLCFKFLIRSILKLSLDPAVVAWR